MHRGGVTAPGGVSHFQPPPNRLDRLYRAAGFVLGMSSVHQTVFGSATTCVVVSLAGMLRNRSRSCTDGGYSPKSWLKRSRYALLYNLIEEFLLVFWIVFDFYLLKMDQRTCIKFCVKNEIKYADAFQMLTVAYGEATLDRSNVYRWYKMFSEGREDVNDEERAGRPSTSTTDEKINEVEKMILANRRITVREVAEDLNISIGSCHSIFINDLGMRRVAAKFVPKLLNCDQKQHRMNIANEMLDSVRDDPNLLQRVITGDEAWVYGYDVETKAQSSQWKLPHEPRPKKARQVRSNVKVLLTVFFDCRGVVHHKFLPQGRTVNKEYYLQVLHNLREAIRQKRPDLWKNKNWLLHHDNAPAHTSLLVRDFLAKNNTLMMPQPPYSPDLAPCDFFLFPKLKRPMKGRRYATLDEIKTASKEELKKILKNDFLKCFEDWKNRWHKCIISHGDYFEGDKIDIGEHAPLFKFHDRYRIYDGGKKRKINSPIHQPDLTSPTVIYKIASDRERKIPSKSWNIVPSTFESFFLRREERLCRRIVVYRDIVILEGSLGFDTAVESWSQSPKM
ncbi:hypothetical protein LAZ67_2002104 [Cordylochernes scorpioides]|uniref:Transposase n=1 Tax=Cordylochernes scorpioides TaxID=51811 RepID=A0ABY6K221_9ARAC|nr:hypothetical protein LAZ67_2002104 [Cordylochernes scorpioides]